MQKSKSSKTTQKIGQGRNPGRLISIITNAVSKVMFSFSSYYFELFPKIIIPKRITAPMPTPTSKVELSTPGIIGTLR
jgi:hypothetical protein